MAKPEGPAPTMIATGFCIFSGNECPLSISFPLIFVVEKQYNKTRLLYKEYGRKHRDRVALYEHRLNYL